MIRYIIIHRRISPRLIARYRRITLEAMHGPVRWERPSLLKVQRQGLSPGRGSQEPLLDWKAATVALREFGKVLRQGWDQFWRVMQRGLPG